MARQSTVDIKRALFSPDSDDTINSLTAEPLQLHTSLSTLSVNFCNFQ